MKNRYKKNFVIIIFSFFFCPLLFTTVSAGYGLSETAGAADLMTVGGASDVQTLVGNVIGTALSLISVIFFALMLYGGFMWMTARGSSEQTRKALDTIIAAVIGIVIVLGAYALTRFVFNSLSGGGTSVNTPANTSQSEQVNCCYTYVQFTADEDNPDNDYSAQAYLGVENQNDCDTKMDEDIAALENTGASVTDSTADFVQVSQSECNAEVATQKYQQ